VFFCYQCQRLWRAPSIHPYVLDPSFRNWPLGFASTFLAIVFFCDVCWQLCFFRYVCWQLCFLLPKSTFVAGSIHTFWTQVSETGLLVFLQLLFAIVFFCDVCWQLCFFVTKVNVLDARFPQLTFGFALTDLLAIASICYMLVKLIRKSVSWRKNAIEQFACDKIAQKLFNCVLLSICTSKKTQLPVLVLYVLISKSWTQALSWTRATGGLSTPRALSWTQATGGLSTPRALSWT
jgi:hypothetical protein